MRVAALQFEPRFLDPEHNLESILRLLSGARDGLIVLPELCFSGYNFTAERQLAQSADDPAGERFAAIAEIARRKSMGVVAGFVERQGGRYYNSAALVTGDGTIGIYRKTHLYGAEKKWFAPGDTGFRVFEWRGTRIGVMVCYDWRFPEAARALALRGAEVICHPSDLVTGADVWGLAMRARAIENKVYIVTANRTGAEGEGATRLSFTGCSQIVSFNGRILASADAGSECLVEAEIEPERTRNKAFSEWNDIFADRRPDLYLP